MRMALDSRVVEVCKHSEDQYGLSICGKPSRTGLWCQECIEFEWPCVKNKDRRYWVVVKLTKAYGQEQSVGILGAPYLLNKITCPFGWGYWLFSPLGALKEYCAGRNKDMWQQLGDGAIVIWALIRANDSVMEYRDEGPVLKSRSPALVVKRCSVRKLCRFYQLTPKQVARLLNNINQDSLTQEKVLQLEERSRVVLRDQLLQLPPAITAANADAIRQQTRKTLSANGNQTKGELQDLLNALKHLECDSDHSGASTRGLLTPKALDIFNNALLEAVKKVTQQRAVT